VRALWLASELVGEVDDEDPISVWFDLINDIVLLQGDSEFHPHFRFSAYGTPAVEFLTGELVQAATEISVASAGHVFAVGDFPGATFGLIWSAQVELQDEGLGGYVDDDMAELVHSSGTLVGIEEPGVNSGTRLIEWSSTGANYEMRIDGNDYTLVVDEGSDDGAWFNTIDDLEKFTVGPNLGALKMLLVVDGAISPEDRALLYTYIEEHFDLDLEEGGGG
jgi:hypothetical protein